MMLVRIDEGDRQVVVLALAELKRRRPGWAEHLDDLIFAFEGRAMAAELDRLHDDLGVAYASTWTARVEALELGLENLTHAVGRLEQRDADIVTGGPPAPAEPRGGPGPMAR